MVTDIPNQGVLLPDRHPQQELFVCDIADAVLKDDMASMEHPFFSLSKKRDMQTRRYERGPNWIEIRPSSLGLATIYDKDILIYAISQLMAAKNEGRKIRQTIVISARELLVFTNRHTGGHDYELLSDALDRLQGTQIKTNVQTGGEEQSDTFSLIDSATLRRDKKTDRIIELRLKLSDWVFNAINADEVLTLHRDYFRLRKPLERRIYEIARKHCGAQDQWKVSVTVLKEKCGSNSPTKHFRYVLKNIVENDHLPDYSVTMDSDDNVIFYNRRKEKAVSSNFDFHLRDRTYESARQVAPGWDVYAIESEWRAWLNGKGMEPPKNPDKAFLGFCEKWQKQRGSAY